MNTSLENIERINVGFHSGIMQKYLTQHLNDLKMMTMFCLIKIFNKDTKDLISNI